MKYKIKIHKSMIFNTVLKIPPKKKMLVYAQIILVCFMLWARDVLGAPSAITYITDDPVGSKNPETVSYVLHAAMPMAVRHTASAR